MAWTLDDGGEITLNGGTEVTLAGPPGSGQKIMVLDLGGVPDNDYALTLRHKKGATYTELLTAVPVVSGGRWPTIPLVQLDATDETLVASLNTAGTPKIQVVAVRNA